jgi:hypothetical protein
MLLPQIALITLGFAFFQADSDYTCKVYAPEKLQEGKSFSAVCRGLPIGKAVLVSVDAEVTVNIIG